MCTRARARTHTHTHTHTHTTPSNHATCHDVTCPLLYDMSASLLCNGLCQCSNLEKQHINEYIIIMDIIHCWPLCGIHNIIQDGNTIDVTWPFRCHMIRPHTWQDGNVGLSTLSACVSLSYKTAAWSASLQLQSPLSCSKTAVPGGLTSSLSFTDVQCRPLFVTEFHL